MDFEKERQKREEFCKIINDLSMEQEALKEDSRCADICNRLEDLYGTDETGERFRHFYSDILSTLTQSPRGSVSGNINVLGQNIAIIRDKYELQIRGRNENADTIHAVRDALKKLYDHVSLEIARMAYSDEADSKLSGEAALRDIKATINKLDVSIKKAQNDCGETKDKLDHIQKEYITILGIFASVVLAFTASIAFSTSVLNNIAQASIYRTICMALTIGLVMVNVLFGLFYYINALVNKEKKLSPLIISNAVLITMLIATMIAWNNGIVEQRNIEVGMKLLTPISADKTQQQQK